MIMKSIRNQPMEIGQRTWLNFRQISQEFINIHLMALIMIMDYLQLTLLI